MVIDKILQAFETMDLEQMDCCLEDYYPNEGLSTEVYKTLEKDLEKETDENKIVALYDELEYNDCFNC
jgi:hypothetical protein